MNGIDRYGICPICQTFSDFNFGITSVYKDSKDNKYLPCVCPHCSTNLLVKNVDIFTMLFQRYSNLRNYRRHLNQLVYDLSLKQGYIDSPDIAKQIQGEPLYKNISYSDLVVLVELASETIFKARENTIEFDDSFIRSGVICY